MAMKTTEIAAYNVIKNILSPTHKVKGSDSYSSIRKMFIDLGYGVGGDRVEGLIFKGLD